MADALGVPEPLPSDTDDVMDALDVAQSLWENGKRVDAIHWVKRAAEAARSDPSRMATLARAVEDLERAAMAARSVTPPPIPVSKPPPPPAVSRPPPPPLPKVSKPSPPIPTGRTTAQASPPAPPVQAAQSVPPPAPTPRSVPSVLPSNAQTPRPVPSVAPQPASPSGSTQASPASTQVQATPSTQIQPPSTQSRVSVAPPAAPVARQSRAPQLLPQPQSEDRVRLAASSPSDRTLRVRASMRVSVKTSVRDGSLLVVRPLAEGAVVPAGTREALLTFVNDDADDVGAST
jgi:hypothetical protein